MSAADCPFCDHRNNVATEGRGNGDKIFVTCEKCKSSYAIVFQALNNPAGGASAPQQPHNGFVDSSKGAAANPYANPYAAPQVAGSSNPYPSAQASSLPHPSLVAKEPLATMPYEQPRSTPMMQEALLDPIPVQPLPAQRQPLQMPRYREGPGISGFFNKFLNSVDRTADQVLGTALPVKEVYKCPHCSLLVRAPQGVVVQCQCGNMFRAQVTRTIGTLI